MGFSMGGHAAVQFTEAAQKEKIKIESMFTVDPVAKGMGWFSSVFMTEHTNHKLNMNRLTETIPWTNLYQRKDSRSLVFMGIRGNHVPGATNYELGQNELEYYERKVGHMAILSSFAVDDRFYEFLRDLPFGSAPPRPETDEVGE
jgi:hypothetical protein